VPARVAPRRLRNAILLWAVGFVVLVLVQPQSAYGTWVDLRYLVLYPVAAIAAWRLDLAPAEIRRLFLTLIAIGAAQALIAILQCVGILVRTRFSPVEVAGFTLRRGIGTMGNPNNLALFLGLPILLLVEDRELPHRGVLLVLLLAGVGVTFSKAAPIALVLAVLIGSRTLRRRARLVLAGVILVVLLVAALGRGTAGLEQRFQSVSDAASAWWSSPRTVLVGEGIGSQKTVAGGVVHSAVTDNMILLLALEGGLVALVLFGTVVFEGWRLQRGTVLASFGVFFLLYAPVSTNFTLFPTALLFWVAAGLAPNSSTALRTSERSPSPTSPRRGPATSPSTGPVAGRKGRPRGVSD
jgi:hypothetical protein